MKLIPLILTLISLSLTSLTTYGQSDTLNRTIDGMKQGYWVVFGKDKPDKGYPTDGKIEEGPYKDNRKNGMWTKYHIDGKTPRLKGMYKMGRPNGAYTKIHDNGEIREKGTYSSKKMVGDFETRNADGIVTQKKTFNKNGREEGLVQIFFDDGTLQMEMNKKDGVVVGDAITYYPNGDVKKKITYSATGEIVSKEDKERVNPPKGATEVAGGGGPSGSSGIKKDGTKFSRDGYNKMYNTHDEIWLDGQFKSGKLWDGKLYKYDSDGILLKIEIWKNGKYHSDGQL